MLYNILFSPTGGTKKAADILTGTLAETQTVIDLCAPTFEGVSLTADDTALIAVPVYAGRVPCTATERLEKIRGGGARAVLLCVYGGRAYRDALAELKATAERVGFRAVAAVAALAEHSVAREVAAGRPDGADRAALEDMAARIKVKLDSGDCTPVVVPGTTPEQPIGNVGGKRSPKPTEDCVRCGICARECPVQAIERDAMTADQGICIGCMRCAVVCPVGARKLGVAVTELGGVAVSILCVQRLENELFL